MADNNYPEDKNKEQAEQDQEGKKSAENFLRYYERNPEGQMPNKALEDQKKLQAVVQDVHNLAKEESTPPPPNLKGTKDAAKELGKGLAGFDALNSLGPEDFDNTNNSEESEEEIAPPLPNEIEQKIKVNPNNFAGKTAFDDTENQTSTNRRNNNASPTRISIKQKHRRKANTPETEGDDLSQDINEGATQKPELNEAKNEIQDQKEGSDLVQSTDKIQEPTHGIKHIEAENKNDENSQNLNPEDEEQLQEEEDQKQRKKADSIKKAKKQKIAKKAKLELEKKILRTIIGFLIKNPWLVIAVILISFIIGFIALIGGYIEMRLECEKPQTQLDTQTCEMLKKDTPKEFNNQLMKVVTGSTLDSILNEINGKVAQSGTEANSNTQEFIDKITQQQGLN